MNTIVWVMMAWAGHGYIPALEFTTEAKCEIAAKIVKEKTEGRDRWATMPLSWCVRIEK